MFQHKVVSGRRILKSGYKIFIYLLALVVSLISVRPLRAQNVTATLTGTVQSGYDQTGVFGTPGATLNGDSYTLLFVFNSAEGQQTFSSCNNVPCGSQIYGAGSSSPGTATITISGHSYTINAAGPNNISSSMQSQFGFGNDDVSFAVTNGLDFAGGQVYPASALLLGNAADWRTSFYSNQVSQTISTMQFSIDDGINAAHVELLTSTVLVDGIYVPTGADLGAGCDRSGRCPVSDPISIPVGNLFESVPDYTTAGPNPLSFVRYYNSMSNGFIVTGFPVQSYATELGLNWRSNFDRSLRITANGVSAERPDGEVLTFSQNGATWAPSTSDVDVALVQTGSQWTLTDHNDTVETYNENSSGEGVLAAITARGGYTQTLTYNSSGQLTSVSDTYSHILTFSYLSGLLNAVTTPDGLVLTYGYTTTSNGTALTSVQYSTNPASTISYLYEDTSQPLALTGVIDEDGNRYATWGYDSMGRAISSQHATGADLTQVTYNDDGSATVTNALGVTDTYTFQILQNVPKVSQISRAATSTTAAASRAFSYDGNGYLSSVTDWNGNQTTYVNDAHGGPTTVTEAVGTSAARTTTITYDSTFVHLPSQIVTPGLTSAFTYDGNGNLLVRTETDTTSGTSPYSTLGQTRTWTNMWSNFLLDSVQEPRTDLTQTTKFGYDNSGALTSVTDALGHVTNITAHTGGGLPLTIVDPNGVTTNLTYDARRRLLTSTVTTAAGPLTTSYAYDAAGNLTKKTLPDGSFLSNTYDAAHRLTQMTDTLGNYIGYTLDALGDRTQSTIYPSSGAAVGQDSGTFDALGRELIDTAGAGQTTTRTYDPNGNALTVTNGLSHTTTNAYDALNRLISTTDANSGVTSLVYDAHDRVINFTDANSNATSYVRDGFGDMIQQTSPDSGVTVYHYDGASDLTSKTDALGIVTNQTFDALNRPLTTIYPADTTENVVYTYDQSGGGFSFGVGRLTSVSDVPGSLKRAYDERGNLLTETRVNGTNTLVTGYTYDGASQIASMTYPDGTLIVYQHDLAGNVIKVTATLPGSSTATTLASFAHLPFGPISGTNYGNGVVETRLYDPSYRPLNINDDLSGTNLQNLIYAYDAANNVSSITDSLNAANGQTFTYDLINRLISAASGAGGYGSFAWTYDKVGNRLTQVQGAATLTYGYTPGTNRLATISPSTTTAQITAHQLRAWGSVHIVASSSGNSSGLNFFGPLSRSGVSPTGRTAAAGNSYAALRAVLGWPMILFGFASLGVFRGRVLTNRVAASIVFGMVAAGATILIGCGGSSGGGRGSGTESSQPVVSMPVISPNGGTFTSAQSVTISDSTTGAAIYYTTNGTTPTTSSTQYTAPIAVSGTETIEAIAALSGDNNSSVAIAIFTINPPAAATPTFSPVAGAFTSAQSVTISDATSGATIYYTTNGSTPSTSSTAYTGPISVSSTETIEAIAVASGFSNSAVGSATYAINTPTAAATPVISPDGGTFTTVQTVTISDTTSGAAIYYTTSGATPTTSSTLYTGSIIVNASETIEAIAVAAGYTNSPVATAGFTVNTPNVISVLTNANGNITSIPPANGTANATFAYNAANRLASVTGLPLAAMYTYDWAGKRFTKQNNGSVPTIYSYALDSAIIAENDNGAATDYIYAEGRLIAEIQPNASPETNQITYLATDHLGTPKFGTNSSGVTVWSTKYQPFGTVGTIAGSINQNVRFPGQLADPETNFYNNLYRDFVPTLGRYLETDPIGLAGGAGTYNYASGNPLRYIDTRGLCVDPGGPGIRFCIEEYIPDQSVWGFGGDNRGPMSNGGTYRSQQLIWNGPNGELESSTTPGISHLGPFPFPGNQGPNSVTITQSCNDSSTLITAIDHTSNGFFAPNGPFPLKAPYAWYDLTITQTGGNVTVSGTVSPFPSVEVWEYGDGAPKLIFNYNNGNNSPANISSPPITVVPVLTE